MAKKSPASQRVRPKDRIESFWVMVNLGQARYWKVTSEGIEKSSAPEDHQGPVLTFDETADFRYSSSKKISPGDARAYFLTEHQEKCRVFSSTPNVYYGTPLGRLQQFGHTLYPGAYYIDMLLSQNKVNIDSHRVVGFSLQVGGPDEFNIVVLYARRANGSMSPPQVALNPPDLDLTIREFANQYEASDEDPILYSVDDLIGMQVGTGYPIEELILGASSRTIKRGVASLLGIMTLVSAATSGYNYTAAMSLADQTKAQQASTTKLNKDLENLLEKEIHAYARMNSVKTDDMFKYAESLWGEYSLVTNATIDRKNGVLKALIPVEEKVQDSSGRITKKLNDFAEIRSQLDKPVIEGLTRSKTTLSQDTNAYQVEYNFKPLDSDFSAVAGAK